MENLQKELNGNSLAILKSHSIPQRMQYLPSTIHTFGCTTVALEMSSLEQWNIFVWFIFFLLLFLYFLPHASISSYITLLSWGSIQLPG